MKRTAAHWVHRSGTASRISAATRVTFDLTVHSKAVMLSCSSFSFASPPQSAFATRPRRRGFRRTDRTCLGFVPHRDFTHACPRPRGFPVLASFRPQAFAASRRFSPRVCSQAYSIPLPRPGLARSGSSPLAQLSSFIRTSVAPLPLIATCSPTARSMRFGIGCHNSRSRLRGLVPRKRAFARLSYSPRRAPLPSSGFVSSRFSLLSPCAPAYRARSAHVVTSNVLHLRLRDRARRSKPSPAFSSARESARLSPNCRPARVFEPFI